MSVARTKHTKEGGVSRGGTRWCLLLSEAVVGRGGASPE